MLAVQVNYQGIQETIRHNKVAEVQNDESLRQGREKLAQNWVSIEETHRHNLATEGLQSASLEETHRHNVETESLGYANLAFNWASLGETKRHNIATEGVAWAQVQLGRDTLSETTRSNKAREFETNRHNVFAENETWRHNMASESIAQKQNDIAQYRANVEAAQGWESIVQRDEANRINRMNAETNARLADIREKEADTNLYDAMTRRMQYETNKTIGFWNVLTDIVGLGAKYMDSTARVIHAGGVVYEN